MKKSVIAALLMIGSIAFGQTVISSYYVSGFWSLSGSPYLIQNDITILSGQSLTVESGVKVKFQPETNLMVNGQLIADGVTFEAIDTSGWSDESITSGGWNGIHYMPVAGADASIFQNNTVRDCKFGYSAANLYTNAFTCNRPLTISSCLFEHNTSGTGLYVADGMITLATQSALDTILFDKCIVRDCYSVFGFIRTSNYWGGFTSITNSQIYDNHIGCAIFGGWNNLLVENNDIYNNESIMDNSAVKLSIGTAVVRGNRIHHNSCEQLATIGCRSGQITIENNLICNNTQNDGDCGMLGGGGAIHLAHNEGAVNFSDTYYIVRNNVIANNYSDYGGGAVYVYKAKATISNNQMVNNSAIEGNEVLISDPLSEVYMKNNLFFGVDDSVGFISVVSANNVEFDYNFIQSSFSNSVVSYSAYNLIGDTINNIIGQDPEMIAPTTDNLYSTDATMANFNVFPTSECVNSGDSSYALVSTVDYLYNPRIIDVIDIGAFEYQNDVNIKELKQNQMALQLTLFPNPAEAGSTISVKSNDTTGEIIIYDIQGKKVKTFAVDSFYTVCDLAGINAGVYFVEKAAHYPAKLIIK